MGKPPTETRIRWLSQVARVSADLYSGRRDYVPRTSEAIDALAGDVARRLVRKEVVQRVSCVGNLGRSILPGRGSQQGSVPSCPCLRGAGREDGRPVLNASRAVAGRFRARVCREQVDGPARSADEALTQPRG